MSAEHADDFHARDIGFSVAHVYHLRERDAFLVFRDTFIDLVSVPRAENSLVDFEDELRLGRVVNSDSRPFSLALGVVDECACENVLELFGDRATFDDFLKSGGIDVMLDPHPSALSVFIDKVEPRSHALEEFDILSEFLELAAFQLDIILLGLIYHQFHVGQDIARILSCRDAVTHFPEFLRRLAYGLDESELLHVSRGKRAVEIVNQCNNWFSRHNRMNLKSLAMPNKCGMLLHKYNGKLLNLRLIHKDINAMEHYFARLQNAVRLYWEKPAVCNYRGESFTYGQLATQIERFHIFFEACGLKKGDRIAICAKNTARMAVSFLSVNTYETVVVPILSDFTPESVNHLVDHSESLILMTDNDIWAKLDIKAMPRLKAVVSVNDFTLLYVSDEKVREAFASVSERFAQKYPMGFTGENVTYNTDNWDDLDIINYTSGTTSSPKGVMLTYKALSATIDFGQRHIPSSDKFTMVSMLPMAHMYGLVYEFLYPLCNGTSITFLGKTPSPTLLLSAMRDVKPYLLITVPLVMEKVFKSAIKPVVEKPVMKVLTRIPGIKSLLFKKIREKLLSALGGNLQMIIMGGAPLNPEVEKWFKKLGLPYTVGYGMTEAAPLLAYEPCDSYVPGSCGKSVDCATVRIDSDDPQHVVGEIQAKGDNICLGYYKAPEATAAAFTEDGYLKTGDLGIIDAEGNIFIKGRSKSMILSANGQNIYPEEVEAVVNNQDYVVESVVVDRASKLVALIYLDQDAIRKNGLDAETVADIPERVRIASNRALPSYSQLQKVEVVDKPFEKTPKMSIKRFMYK